MTNPRILVVDRNESLAEQLRTIVADMTPRPEVDSCTRIGAVGDMLEAESPYDVIVAGPSLATRSGLARLEVIHDELPTTTLFLAFSRRPDAALRDIVRTGAVDLVQLPIDDSVLRESLERVLELARKQRVPISSGVATGMSVVNGQPRQTGAVFTLSSATGGCGKTFLATNLAYLLSHYTGKRACIVDLDLQFGEVSTALRLRPKYTIYDALRRDNADESDLRDHIEEYMVEHETGISVLAAPKDPSEADRIDPPDVTRVIEALRSRFDYVVVDTPAALTEIVLAAFDLSDTLFSMATLDLPSVRNMGVFLNTLDRLKIPSDNIRLILNKAESDVGIDVDQVTKLFAQGFKAVLPYAKEVSRSINVGMPVLAASPTAPISRLILEGFKELLPEDEQARIPAAFTADTGGFRRFFRRNTLAPSTTH